MFSDIEVLAINAAERSLQIQPELEIPPSQIADLEQPLLEHVHDVVVDEGGAFPSLQIVKQSFDEPTLAENDQIDFADLSNKMETLLESTLPVPDISNAIPPPLTSQGATMDETPVAPAPDRQPRSDDLSDVGIGALTGIAVTGMILVSTSQIDIFNNLGRIVLLGLEVLCGIVGAIAAKSSKKTRRAIWIGAIQWSLAPVLIGLFIILLIYLLFFTNLYGV